ncbi:hypothetical protein ACQWTT_001246 [Acinetobacter baumannii]
MSFKNIISGLILTTQATFVFASPPLPDRNVTVVYAPTITINPDEDQSKFPNTLLVKLLINKEGFVERVYFPDNTSILVKNKIEKEIRFAKFTPYLRQGIAVKSIVPYVLNFSFISEEEYRGY